MELDQVKKLLHIKGNNYQTGETAHKLGENLCSYSMDKGLIYNIYKELKRLNTKRTNNTINKWANELNRQFLEVLMANQVRVAHTCNPSYSGDRDQENCGSKPAWANRSWILSQENPS
jgi:hypothetical protein